VPELTFGHRHPVPVRRSRGWVGAAEQPAEPPLRPGSPSAPHPWWSSRRARWGTRVRCVVAALLRRAGIRRRTGHEEPPRLHSARLTSLGAGLGGQGSRCRRTGRRRRRGRTRCRGPGRLSRLLSLLTAPPRSTTKSRQAGPLLLPRASQPQVRDTAPRGTVCDRDGGGSAEEIALSVLPSLGVQDVCLLLGLDAHGDPRRLRDRHVLDQPPGG